MREQVRAHLGTRKENIMGDYKKLDIWQRSMALVMEIYRVTDNFPNTEMFGLSSQMQRAIVSVPSNIAEGYGRESDREFYYFLTISKGSLNELQTQLYVAAGREYIPPDKVEEIDKEIDEIGRMIFRFMKRLR